MIAGYVNATNIWKMRVNKLPNSPKETKKKLKIQRTCWAYMMLENVSMSFEYGGTYLHIQIYIYIY